MRIIALVPARGGSKRLPGKNLMELNGHPLVAYAIGAAQEAGLFEDIVVSSDDAETLEIARRYGAHALECPLTVAHKDDDPDILWVEHAFEHAILHGLPRHEYLQTASPRSVAFAIIRPTSPFRRGSWIAQAWQLFKDSGADSLRAMRPVTEHPGKMWLVDPFDKQLATPVMVGKRYRPPMEPWHSSPTQGLPSVWVQTAALEIAWVDTVLNLGTIAGRKVLRWHTDLDAPEAIDINTQVDWERAYRIADSHPEYLPFVQERVLTA